MAARNPRKKAYAEIPDDARPAVFIIDAPKALASRLEGETNYLERMVEELRAYVRIVRVEFAATDAEET